MRRFYLRVLTALVLATVVAAGLVVPSRADAAPPADPRVAQSQCVGSAHVTLPETFDIIFDSLMPVLPASVREHREQYRLQARRALHDIGVSTTSISAHPYQLGATKDSPIMKYREPLSTYIVTQLLDAKNGQSGRKIRLDTMTLGQAVETVYLYLYVGVVIPATLAASVVPPLFPVGPFSLGSLITLPIIFGTNVINIVMSNLSSALGNACLAHKTGRQKAEVLDAQRDLNFTQKVPQMVQDIANQVDIADDASCPSIGSQPLSRVVTKTADYLKAHDPRSAATITDRQHRLEVFMRTIRVPLGAIPTDTKDFTTVESLLALVLGLVPNVGGPLTTAIVGLGDKAFGPPAGRRTVPLSDVPLTSTLTAVQYAYSITTQVLAYGTNWVGSTVGAMFTPMGGINAWNFAPRPWGIINAPNTYGVGVLNDTVRSLCFVGDRVVPPTRAPARTAGR